MVSVLVGDALERLKELQDGSIDCCVTSPPYYKLRDYKTDGQVGQENTPEKYIDKLRRIFQEVERVLKDDGTLWVNIGDSYTSCIDSRKLPYKEKELIGIPWMLAFALRSDGWYLRQDIIWNKTNTIPESVTDRCVRCHEYIFLFSKRPHYYFNHKAIQEKSINGPVKDNGVHERIGGKKYTETPDQFYRTKSGSAYNYTGKRNKRDVWNVATAHTLEKHFATFPEALITPCILAGTREGETVLDPFAGIGTTGVVANKLGRNAICIEINPDYAKRAQERTTQTSFADIL